MTLVSVIRQALIKCGQCNCRLSSFFEPVGLTPESAIVLMRFWWPFLPLNVDEMLAPPGRTHGLALNVTVAPDDPCKLS